MKTLGNTEPLQFIATCLRYFALTPNQLTDNFVGIGVAVAIYLSILLAQMSLFLILLFLKKKPMLLVQSFKAISLLTLHALLIPMSLAFFESLNCVTKLDGSIVVGSFQSQVCMEGWHYFSYIASIMGVIVMSVMHLTVSYFDFELHIEQNAKWIWADKSISRLKLIFRIASVASTIFFRNSSLWILTVAFRFFGAYTIFYQISHRPFIHTQWFSKILSIFWATFVLTAANEILQINYPVANPTLWLFSAYVMCAIYACISTQRPFRLINFHIVEILDKRDILFNLEHISLILLRLAASKDYKQLIGVLSKHKSMCAQKHCPVRVIFSITSLKIDDNDINQQIYRNFLDYLDRCYRVMIDRFPHDNDLKIAYCFFLVQVHKSPSLALNYLMRFQSTESPNLIQRFRLYILRAAIVLNGGSHQEQFGSDTISLTSKRDLFNKVFYNDIKSLTYTVLNFWEVIQQDQIDYAKAVKLSDQFYENFRVLQSKKDQMSFETKNDIRVLFVYSEFLKLILNDVNQAQEIIRLIQEKIRLITNIQKSDFDIGPNVSLVDFSFPAIVVNVTKPSEYTILSSNTAFEHLFGYEQDSLKNKSLNSLIPPSLRHTHDLVINRYVGNIGKNDFYRKKFLMGLHKNGYLTPFIVHTKYMENIANGFKYLFAFSVVDDNFFNSCYILLDSEFKIAGASKSSNIQFGIKPDKLFKFPHVNEWIKDFDSLCQKYVNKILIRKLIPGSKANNSCWKNWEDPDQKFRIEIIQWNFQHINRPSFYLAKLDEIREDLAEATKHDQLFSMKNPFKVAIRDKSLENLLEIAKESNALDKHERAQTLSSSRLNRTGEQGFSMRKVANEFEYEGIKLLRLKKNKLFEFDKNEIQKRIDKEEIADELAQANINLELRSLDINHSASDLNVSDLSVKNFIDEHKFMRFIQNYNKRFNIILLRLSFFITVLVFLSVYLADLLKYKSTQANKKNVVSNDFILNTKFINFAFVASDISMNYIYSMQNITLSSGYYTDVRTRVTSRANRIKELSEQFEASSKNLNLTIEVPVIYGSNLTQLFDFQVLEQLLMGSLFNLVDQNQTFTAQNKKKIDINDNRYFFLKNLLGTYLSALQTLANMNLASYSDLTDSMNQSLTIFNIIPIIFLATFAIYYFIVLWRSHVANLMLIRIFVKIDDFLIDKRIRCAHFLLNIIDRIFDPKESQADKEQSEEFNKMYLVNRLNYRKKFLIKTGIQVSKAMIICGVLLLAITITFPILFNKILAGDEQYLDKAFREYRLHDKFREVIGDYLGLINVNLGLNLTIYGSDSVSFLSQSGKSITRFVNNYYYFYLNTVQFFSQSFNAIFHQVSLNNMCSNLELFKTDAAIKNCQSDLSKVGLAGMIGINRRFEEIIADLRKKTLTKTIKRDDFVAFTETGQFIRESRDEILVSMHAFDCWILSGRAGELL